MSITGSIIVEIQYYDNKEKYIALPLDYNSFIKEICLILNIKEELIKNFQISYYNNLESQIYCIKNSDDYILFFKTCKAKKAKIINIKLLSDFNNEINNNKNEIQNNPFNNNPLNGEINAPGINTNFSMNCDLCKHNKSSNIIYYCSDCKIFFCNECEIKIGKIHKHSYYKIRTQKQFNELKNSLSSFGNKFDNKNKNINNTGKSIENSVKEILWEGSKIFGNIGNSLKNLFNQHENQENQNNEINPNELVNPYVIRKNNKKQKNDDGEIPDEKQLKILIINARTYYNLSEFNDIDIERALIQSKGDIGGAVQMLFLNKDL